MANVSPGGLVDGTIDPKDMPGMHADRTTEEVVADIIAENPAKHGVTLEERKRRALADAAARAADEAKFFEEPEGEP